MAYLFSQRLPEFADGPSGGRGESDFSDLAEAVGIREQYLALRGEPGLQGLGAQGVCAP